MHAVFNPISPDEILLPLRSAELHHGAASVQQLEHRSFNAWPGARCAVAGDWLLRSTNGYTKRANSANALQPAAQLDPMLLWHIEAWYQHQRQPSIFRLSPLADSTVDTVLDEHGYQLIEPSIVMQRAGQAQDANWQPARNVCFRVQTQLSEQWLNSYCAAGGLTPTRQDALRLIQQSITMPCAYASIEYEGECCAWGLAVLEREAAGLYEVMVLPSCRGKGLGRQLLYGLLQWAARQGATHTDLQVTGGNATAQQLYTSLGFQAVYGYHYRVKPR
ncbi:GNAT family N-acetyltransferase [Pusillimonas sp. MFBS29]|uniref:GNAT family N-acetyltransferase n=1 Tax=Pusillimonas sp. MFBS29 TaxID=2886690 RepID=UPI001D130641|nr:GNAT family N-acetyltransferase [Pusillimonas sp. MFBS29]MCC2595099.1 GNAT family N-acetyltransferase [Pusillimonas sp. MFBS29]